MDTRTELGDCSQSASESDPKHLNDYKEMYNQEIKGFEDKLNVLGKEVNGEYVVGDEELGEIKEAIKRAFNIPKDHEVKIASGKTSGSAFIEGKIGGTILAEGGQRDTLEYEYDFEEGKLNIGEVSGVARNEVPKIIKELEDLSEAEAGRVIKKLPSHLQDFAKTFIDLGDSNFVALKEALAYRKIEKFPSGLRHELRKKMIETKKKPSEILEEEENLGKGELAYKPSPEQRLQDDLERILEKEKN